MNGFRFNEKYLSQIPALQQLINMGYEYLTPAQVSAERGGRLANVLLENILRERLKEINRIHFQESEYPFSEENIQSAIQKIKNVQYDGQQEANEQTYDLITLGTSLQQTIKGNARSYTLNYIDWQQPASNVFHVAAEFSIERSHSTETVRPDIVLFVNGIPLVVIECKSPDTDVEQAVLQNIRNQGEDYIPRFFTFMQLLLALNKNEAKYGTVGTPRKFWSVWRELEDTEDNVSTGINHVLSGADKAALFSGQFAQARAHFDRLEQDGGRLVTGQDKCLYSLCRPARLLEIIYGYIIFDTGIKKIARYQQFFLVRSALKHIKTTNPDGTRNGGIVWHTQGSGKSITMVMLVRALALDAELTNPRIILVTDRKDLEKQLGNTFVACGLNTEQATSGRGLVKHIKNKVGIITTLINKFETAYAAEKHVDASPDIIVLVDESHRSNFGALAAGMRLMLPGACYIGFTGTPISKEYRNSFTTFGRLIEPHYSVRQAIEDGAVVPLLYEGRHVEIEQNKEVIDLWFERSTENLNSKQKADLKKKFSRGQALNEADQVIYMRAFDISHHYQSNWQGTGFKAQLVSHSKIAALKYHEFFDEIGMVSSEVVISPPDMREGGPEVDVAPSDKVSSFWKRMMTRHGSEEKYNQQIINRFKQADEPEILIVVDKLITGFDAPRNTVLYLCRNLREHTLLQAIARVNRLHEGKEFGYIVDYANVLGELDKALTAYDALSGFDEGDLTSVLASINDQVSELPQRYSTLWDLFKELKGSADEERYEVLLADDALRSDFYERLAGYSKSLAIALSATQFIINTPQELLSRYKSDLKRFQKLRVSVKRRYAEIIDYRDYEPRIKKLLDTHIQANEVTRLNEPVNIFDDETFTKIKDKQGEYKAMRPSASADTIAHATKRMIMENMERDPAFYEKFSTLIQDTIDAFRAQHISDLEYLNKVSDIRDQVVNMRRDDVPESIRNDDNLCAFFGVIKPCLAEIAADKNLIDQIAAETSLAIKTSMDLHWKVDFWHDNDAQNAVKNEVDDFFFDVVGAEHGIELSSEQMDEIFNRAVQVAKGRRPS